MWTGVGISCFLGLVAPTLGSREASIGPCQGLVTGTHDPYPDPALWPPLLTTMEAKMGTWMIHFLFPELKSQHLGEVEASVPTCCRSQPKPSHREAPELVCSDISCPPTPPRAQDRGVSYMARPEAILRGPF